MTSSSQEWKENDQKFTRYICIGFYGLNAYFYKRGIMLLQCCRRISTSSPSERSPTSDRFLLNDEKTVELNDLRSEDSQGTNANSSIVSDSNDGHQTSLPDILSIPIERDQPSKKFSILGLKKKIYDPKPYQDDNGKTQFYTFSFPWKARWRFPFTPYQHYLSHWICFLSPFSDAHTSLLSALTYVG